jgi:hypothetical protein
MQLQLRPTNRRRNFTIGLFLGVALMMGWQYWRAARANSTAGMPKDETAFVNILQQSRLAWLQAPNDLARNPMRATRAAALCKAVPTLSATGWSGRVVSVLPDGFPDYAGRKTVTIILALTTDISLTTPAAPLLNDPSTMLQAGSPIYATAATLRPGEAVNFSGRFFPGADCMDETRLTLSGGMTAPRWKFQLTALTSQAH